MFSLIIIFSGSSLSIVEINWKQPTRKSRKDVWYCINFANRFISFDVPLNNTQKKCALNNFFDWHITFANIDIDIVEHNICNSSNDCNEYNYNTNLQFHCSYDNSGTNVPENQTCVTV